MELKYVPTTCPYCGTGCGFNIVVKDGRAAGIEPWHRAPVNAGKLCQKGRYAHEFIHSKDRLVKPLVRENGQLVETSWEEALALIAGKFMTYLPEEIACLSSARTSNEENYLMQKFARAVLKTSNIDHCARLCHSSTVAGLAAVFGSGAMTNSILDIEESKCIFIIGSNTLEQHPLIGRRVMLAKKKGAKIICADPRCTPTAKQADLHLSMYSGTDVALLNGLMHHIIENGWEDSAFISKRTKNYEEMKSVVMQETYSLSNVSKITGVPEEDLKTAAEWIAQSKPSALLYSMGITQHTVGVDNVRSTANLMLLTGNLGVSGGGVNPLRGQNNVQGACDMGCLPDVYPGYQKVADPENNRKMESIWGVSGLPKAPGLTVTELMEQLAEGTSTVKCMYVMGENFMLSDPDLNKVRKAMKQLDFLVVQDLFLSETAEFADVVLPAACYAEKHGTQTNTERRVQRIRKAVDPPGGAKADWRIICELAGCMGYGPQFSYTNEAEIFEEIAKVTPQYGGMSYERLEKPDSVKKERIAKGKFIVETPEEEFSIPIDKLEEANFGRRSNCRRCKLKIPRQADLACGEWGVMGMEATFVEVCSAKGAELLKQAKIAGVVETFPPVPKGVEIRGKIEKSMLKLADGWREKDFQSLGEGKTRLKQLMDETSRCIKCYTCIEVCPALSGTKVSDFTITPGKVPPSFAFHALRYSLVADSCINCGQCEELCPMDIPNALFMHSFAVEFQELYGYQAGQDLSVPNISPLEIFRQKENRKKLGCKKN